MGFGGGGTRKNMALKGGLPQKKKEGKGGSGEILR